MKRFPLGQYSQTVVEAALAAARAKSVAATTSRKCASRPVTTAIKLMAGDPDKWEPKTRESADHSMPYTVAVALMHGEVEEKHFGERYLRDSKCSGCAEGACGREREADARMPDAMFCRMTVVTTSGADATRRACRYPPRATGRTPCLKAEDRSEIPQARRRACCNERRRRGLLEALWNSRSCRMPARSCG